MAPRPYEEIRTRPMAVRSAARRLGFVVLLQLGLAAADQRLGGDLMLWLYLLGAAVGGWVVFQSEILKGRLGG